MQPVKTITDEKKSITTIHSSRCRYSFYYICTPLSHKKIPSYLIMYSLVCFEKKYVCIFYATMSILLHTTNMEQGPKKFVSEKFDWCCRNIFFGQTPITISYVGYFSMIQWQHSEYRMYNNSYPVSLFPLYIHNSTTKKSVAFFYFSHVIRIFRPIYYYKRLSPVWRILLMIWIWQESLGKPPSPPPPSLLADFLISLDENYYSSSSSRGTEE